MSNTIYEILEKEIFLLVLASIMIAVGILKEQKSLNYIYYIVRKAIINDRLFICIMSMMYGVLPIPGRISVATGMFDTCTSDKKCRSDLGILAYLATHHYYLWSPLEKSVLIVLASTGMSYVDFICHMWIYVVVMIVCTLYYVMFVMSDVELVHDSKKPTVNIIDPGILIGGVVACCIGWVSIYWFFPAYCIYLIGRHRYWSAIKHIDWKLIGVASIIIAISTILQQHSTELLGVVEGLTTKYGLHVCLIGAFVAAFLLGSSSKFAAVTAIMVAVFGIEYLPLFYIFDFGGYLLSPSHKCLFIGKLYFQTKLVAFYRVVGIITLIMIVTALINTFMTQ